MKKNEMIEVVVNSMNVNGEAVSRNKNMNIYIPRAVPGDTVRIKITHLKEHTADGELVKVVKPSEVRVKSGCNSFEQGCGGCQWLSLSYPEQLVWKNKILGDILKYQGNIKIQPDPIIGMEDPSYYRNKLSLLVRDKKLVFMQEDSQKTIVLDQCPQEMQANQKVYDKLKTYPYPDELLQMHLRSNEAGMTGICFFVKRMTQDVKRLSNRIMKENKTVIGIGASSYREYYTIAGKAFLEQNIGEINYRIPLNGFFQTNYIQAGVLQRFVDEMIGSAGNDSILDLYCGSGFFSLAAARKAKRVLGVENNIDAIKSARINAKINQIVNAEFVDADVRIVLKDLKPAIFQTIILDPPRQGCESAVIQELLRLRPRKLIYISCSPESLARDLKTLSEKYNVISCRPVDMFPHTFHIETVVQLEWIERK